MRGLRRKPAKGPPMTPDDLRALRKELHCTAKELGLTLGLEPETVSAWERGDMFPTKASIERMQALRAQGPDAIVRKRRPTNTPFAALADPELWTLVRKLIAHTELRKAVAKLAAKYADPTD